jgi:hypothetical protein
MYLPDRFVATSKSDKFYRIEIRPRSVDCNDEPAKEFQSPHYSGMLNLIKLLHSRHACVNIQWQRDYRLQHCQRS